MTQPLILASTSPYREALLRKLGVPFATAAPDGDERRRDDEAARDLVVRLAKEKASSVSAQYADALIIGCDQVASLDGMILGKPGSRDNAIRQLTAASDKTVRFFTGLCLLNAATGHLQSDCDTYDVTFKPLSHRQIERYVDAEQPFNCAGSFKSEGYGITLFRELRGRDPNTLIGLPLIRLVEMLAREGIERP